MLHSLRISKFDGFYGGQVGAGLVNWVLKEADLRETYHNDR
jgi:hypothetical protein